MHDHAHNANPTAPLTPSAARLLIRELHAKDETDLPSPCPVDIDGYTVDRLLGTGASSEVYLARRDGSEQRVAIKILRSQPQDRDRQPRLWRELDILSQLRLESVPRLLDYGHADSRAFIVTEYVEGWPIDHYCQRFHLDRRQRIQLLIRVAEATQTLHEHAIIHRDIKPSNIVVTASGQPVLIDLGIATLTTGQHAQTLTHDGAPLGTPAFMPPEQARGQNASVSSRSDIYALGATSMLVLTRRPPHNLSGSSLIEAIHTIAHSPAPDVRTTDPTLSKPLAAVLNKALHFDHAQRYASSSELADDLRRVLKGEPVHASPPSPWQRVMRVATRHPIATTTCACLLLFLSTLGATALSVWWWNAQPSRIELSPDRSTLRLLARSGRELHIWHARSEGDLGFRFAELVEIPAPMGGGRAVVMLRTHEQDATVDRQVSIWHLSDLTTPMWRTNESDPTLKAPPPHENPEETYDVKLVRVEDIFPDIPGHEIVAEHTSSDHPSALRVYDLQGNVHFEAWHYGSLADWVWLPDARRMVIAASHGQDSWPSLGAENPPYRWPLCVMAFDVHRGARHRWIEEGSPNAQDHPLWHKALLPVEIYSQCRLDLTPPLQRALQGDHFQVVVQFNQHGLGGVGWTLTRDGEILPKPYSSGIGDGTYLNLTSFFGEGVQPEDIRLVDIAELTKK
ncbi:MAG: serine/threonine protein kinase [Phycisphaerales bacterium JB043]